MTGNFRVFAASLACALGVGLLGCEGGDETLAAFPPRDGGVGTTGGVAIVPGQSSGGSTGGSSGGSTGGSSGGSPSGSSGGSTSGGPSSGSSSGGSSGGASSGGSSSGGRPTVTPPWPTSPLTVYGADAGIQELPVVAAQPDEANNLWVVTHQALYLMRPGETTFHRYTDADGLHVGLALQPYGITAVAGGAPDQCFVGYEGVVDGNIDAEPPISDQGKFDRVDLKPDGSLSVERFDVHDTVGAYWENRSVRRFLYDHDFHPGNLYVGMNHGVDRVLGDEYADHVHPTVCLGKPCTWNTSLDTEEIGEWRGLAFDAAGNLWMAGQYTAGELGWTASLTDWIENGDTGPNPFKIAFGDPYPPFPPVFLPPAEGDSVDIRAVAVDPKGTVWFASGPEWSDSDPQYGIASWTPSGGFSYFDPMALGFGTKALVDMVALPDGRLVFGTEYDGLRLWNPMTGAVQELTAAQGLPGDQIQVMYLDTRNGPPTLFVGTDGGLAIVQP
ncbi:MAG: hypothetical protein ACYDCL_09665 [Myxococcales bacterium]